MESKYVIEVTVKDVEKRREPSKHYVSTLISPIPD